MLSALDVSTSALVAHRIQLDAISSNVANASTQRNENGELEPYQARFAVFQTDESVGSGPFSAGVKVASVETESKEPRYKPDPNHPLAIKRGPHKGKVAYPAVNILEQMVDAMQATRAYEANVGVIEITKAMAGQTLRILG